MRSLWIVLTVGLCSLVNGELRQSVSATKLPWSEDLYLDDAVESGNWPVDDDDYDSSGSGSGNSAVVQSATFNPPQMIPDIQTTAATTKLVTARVEPTMQKKMVRKPVQSEMTVDTPIQDKPKKTDDFVIEKPTINTDDDTEVSAEKHSESLFQRTEVLAAVIAGGVIGFLFAIFLILLLVYRMRKKDEGSYDLGERKPSTAAYQKAPTKEFYA